MCMTYARGGVALFGMVLSMVFLQAQETQWYIHAEKEFRSGLELFDENNFAASREKFESLNKNFPQNFDHGNEVLRQNVEYYIAVCAAECGDKDAERLLNAYLVNHHETDKRRLIYLYLGKLYYRNGKYTEAAEQLAKVDIKDLNNRQVYDHKFMLGYCYFVKKKFSEARPLFSAVKDVQDKYYYPANYYYSFICFYLKDYNEALKGFTKIEDSKMYASVIPYYIVQIYYIKKDYDKTILYINQSVAKPDVLYKEEMKFLLGQVYFQKSEYAKALPLLDNYISKNSKAQKEDIYRLAYCQYQTGAYTKAIENFKQLNLIDDKMGQNATYALADCYLKTNQKDKARSAFQSAASANHDLEIKQDAQYNYAKLCFETNYVNEAIKAFEDYLAVYSDGKYAEDVNEMLAAALVQTKNYDRAYKLMEKMKLNSAMLKEAYQKVTYFRAIELYNDGNYADALMLCNKSLTTGIQPELKAMATYLKGEVLFQLQEYNAASNEFLKYIELNTSNVESKGVSSRFRSLYNTGYCAFKQKNYTDALLYFGNAIAESNITKDDNGKKSLLSDLYLRYADCGFVTKSYNKAIEGYTTIVSNNWASAPYAQYQKGIIYGLQGKGEEKISAMNLLIDKYGTSSYADQAYYEIGETHLNTGNYTQARSAYQNLISKYPTSKMLPKSYLKIAVIDYNSGKKEQALEDYKTVVKKFPNTSEANEAMGALKEIYIELGRAQEYFDFAKNTANINISSSEQDSLLYESALKVYDNNDCEKAVNLFGNYLQQFPIGIFANEAHWKKSECHIKAKLLTEALPHLEALVQNKYSRYYERALQKAAGICYYDLKQYEKALTYYKQWYIASSNPANTYTCMIGMLNAAHKLGKQDEVIEYADQLLNSGTAKEIDIQDAYYKKGIAWYAKQEKDFALKSFNRVAEYPVNEKCVESKYMVAKILHEQGLYKQSLDTCFKLKNKYGSYEYWVVKTYILMADNYYALNNAFQAKATLESIVNNYDGDAALLNEAKEKLEKIRSEELNKSKLMMIPQSDTIIFESDSIFINKQ